MTKKKDFFKRVLNDVKPLKKFSMKDKEKKEIKNLSNKNNKKDYKININVKSQSKQQIEKIKNNYTKKVILNERSSFFKKLKRGKVKINKTIDLHGLTLTEAEEKFEKEIEMSFYRGNRCILFITGKGLRNRKSFEKDHKLYYGKIKTNIYGWTNKKEIQEKILYFSTAHTSHGGEGSFYVYLRKNYKY